MEVPTNPTRESAFVWICGSFLISANEIRISREDFFGSGPETHGKGGLKIKESDSTFLKTTVFDLASFG
jgi:hypothetical protein